MKKLQYLILVIILLVFVSVSLAGENDSAGWKRPSIDLFDLMALYMIPDSESYTVQSWWTGAQPGSPIEWKTSGIEWGEKLGPSVRLGEVMVTINGKPLYVLKKYVEPVSWKIRLVGAHAGVRRIEILPPTSFVDFNLEEELRKRKILFDLYKCDPEHYASNGERVYRIVFPNKKPSWLHYAWSCGSGGCSGDFTLFLEKYEADQVPNLVTNCQH
jgi:hypothetical protein